jgi:hypothetical protein
MRAVSQRHFAADRIAFADLEARFGFARVVDDRLLTGDQRHVAHGVVHDLLVANGFAHAHVQRDLHEPRHLHHVLIGELLHQTRTDVVDVVSV